MARPDRLQRCQIVADKLLTSIMNGNEATAMLMAGYIALRMPGAIGVDIDAAGEMQNWHVDAGPGAFSERQLVAIWYLNDVPGPGGETEFPLQEVAIRPAQGKLILFPPFWTHAHRGVALERGVKYIATTWICFA